MTDDAPEGFTYLVQLLVERATTLSVELEALRLVLEAHGVFSAAEFEAQKAAVRARWELPQHPNASLSQELAPAEYAARIRRLLADGPPPARGS